MPLMWDFQSGKLQNVPDQDVTMGVASGRLSFRKGVRIPVVAPDGREGTIAAEDSGAAFQNGWRFQSAAEVAEKTKAGIEAAKAEAYNAPVTAFASGALSAATLGLGDVAMRALGSDTEVLKEIRERSPVATTAGEIVGSIAALASPVTPAAGIAKLGAGATKAASSIAATTRAGKIVQSLGKAGAIGSAIEGMAYGAGTLLTEEALGEPNLTASQMIGTVGLSGLLGAGLGVVGKGASTAWNKWKASASNPVALMSEGYGKSVAKAFGLTGDAEKEVVGTFARENANGRAEMAHYMANADELYARGLQAVENLEKAGKAGAKATGEARQGLVEQATGIYTPKQTEAVNGIVAKMEDAIKEIRSSEVYERGVADKIAQTSEDFLARLNGAETQSDVFNAVHGARAELDQFTKTLRGDKGFKSQNTLKVVTDIREGIQSHLRDAETYGDLAKGFEEADSIFTKYMAARDNFRDQFMASKFVSGAGKTKELAPGKVKGFFQRPDAESMAFKKETVSQLESSVKEMQEYTAKNGVNFPVDLDAISSEIATVRRLRTAELALSGIESFTGKSLSGAVGGAALGSLGYLFGEDTGHATSTGLAITGLALANPRMAVKYLSKMERLQNEFGMRADNALTRLLSLPRKEALPTVSAAGAIRRATLMELVHTLAPGGEKAPTHDDALDSLSPYLTDPSKLDDRMVDANPHLDGVAPNTYAAMVNQTHEALKFMQQVWPKKASSDALFVTPGALSASERHQMEAYAMGAFSPGVLLSQLETGAIDPRTVEAVRVVHPELFADLQRRIIEKMPEATNIPTRKKQAIGMAFGIPSTPGLANVGTIQRVVTHPLAQPEAQQAAPDLTQLGKNQQPTSMQIATR